jgi:cytochrome c oxidase subunit 1
MNPTNSNPPTQFHPPLALRRLTLIWAGAMFLLFPILTLLGLLMRVGQGNWLHNLPPEVFYAVMTLHGLGMVGLWFALAMAGVCFLLSRYVQLSLWASWLALVFTVAGVAMLIICTLVGRFGAGWYFLYPLPLRPGNGWPAWASGLFIAAIATLGVGWLVWVLDTLRAIARRYPLKHALGWHLLRGHTGPAVPPIVLISTVTLIATIAALVAGVIVLVLFVMEKIKPGFVNDALLMKNLTFLFGHLLVNLTLYLGVAMLYEVMPSYCGRPWKTASYVALAWNCVLLLVIFAFLHHLYMDFVQLRALQVVGQIASYLTSVPAAVATIFGLFALVFGSNLRWTLGSRLLFLGVLGWVIGGIGAVIDSTIVVNLRYHNTLWVPAHFHTYYLMGVVLMILGMVYHICQEIAPLPENPGRSKLILTLLCLGGYGFLLMFYYAGAHSVPRRYATYPDLLPQGVASAQVASGFIVVFLAGLLLYLWETGKRWRKALFAP